MTEIKPGQNAAPLSLNLINGTNWSLVSRMMTRIHGG